MNEYFVKVNDKIYDDYHYTSESMYEIKNFNPLP